MDFSEEYRQKLTSADEAVKVIKSGDWVDYGWCTNTVDALDKALAKRTDELKDINLRGLFPSRTMRNFASYITPEFLRMILKIFFMRRRNLKIFMSKV